MNNQKYIIAIIIFILIFLNFNKDPEHLYIFSWDYATMFKPWLSYYINHIKTYKSFALWNPFNFCGEPFINNPQINHFYPINILFFIFPFELAFEIKTQLHFIILAIFYFLFFHKIFKNYFVVIFSLTTLLFSNFFIDNIDNPTVLNAITYLPILLFTLFSFYESKKIKYLYFFAIANLLHLLSGHPQFIFYNYLILFPFFILLLCKSKNSKKNFLILFLSFFIFSFLISLIQYYPILKNIKLYTRTSTSSFIYNSIYPFHFITALLPDFFGNIINNNFIGKYFKSLHSNYTIYEFTGIISFLFFIISFTYLKSKKILFIVIGIIFVILMAFGNYTPFYAFFSFFIFPFRFFREPSRILYIYTILISLLSGFLLNKLFIYSETKNFLKRIKNVLIFLIIIFLIIQAIIIIFNEKIIIKSFEYIAKFKKISYEKFSFYIWHFNRITNLIIVLSIKFILLFIFFALVKNIRYLIIALIIFNLFDLISFNYRFINYVKSFDSEECESILNYIKADNELFRVLSLLNSDSYFDKNQNLLIRKHSVKGYNPMIITETKMFFDKIELQKNKVPDDGICYEPDVNLPIINTLGIKYIISNKLINNKNFELILYNQDYNQYLFLNKNFQGLFWTANNVISDSTDFLFTTNFDFKHNVYIKEFAIKYEIKASEEKDRINLIKYQPDRVKLRIKKEDDGILIYSDFYHKNWKCKINNKEAKIYKANQIFKGIYLKKGEFDIEFIYTYF